MLTSARTQDALHRLSLLLLAALPPLLIVARSAADAAFSLIPVLFLLHSAARREWAWARRPYFLVSLALWAWLVLVVTPLALDPGASLVRSLPWIRYPLFLAALTEWVLADRKTLRRMSLYFGALLALVAADALVQFLTGISLSGNPIRGERLTGPFNNVKVGVFLARLSLPVCGALLALAAWRNDARQLVSSGALLSLLLCVTLLSGERAAFLNFALGFTVAGGVLALRYPRLRLPVAAGLMAMCALTGLLVATQPTVRERAALLVKHVAHFHDSPYGKLFQAAVAVSAEHPLSGAGLRGFRLSCGQVLKEEDGRICDNLHPHNYYLEWLTEAGGVGLIGFLALLAALCLPPLSALEKRGLAHDIAPAFALGTLSMHFFPFSASQSMFSNWPAMLLWLSISLALAALNANKPEAA